MPQDLQYWIGLTDEVEEGKWVWQDSFLVADYTHWASGQPDGGTEDNCAIFVTINFPMVTHERLLKLV